MVADIVTAVWAASRGNPQFSNLLWLGLMVKVYKEAGKKERDKTKTEKRKQRRYTVIESGLTLILKKRVLR